MRKIIQINTVSNTRSTGKIAEGIATALHQVGYQSYIGYGHRGRRSNFSSEITIGHKADFFLHALGTRLTDRHGFYSAQATKKFLTQLENLKPDLIHLHNIHGYYLNIELLFLYLKEKGIPVVWTLHDCWSYTGHCAYYSACGCLKWQTHCEKCPQTANYPKSFVDQSSKNYSDKKMLFSGIEKLTLVMPSEWLANEVSQSFLSDYPRKVINNGIDLNQFKLYPTQPLRDRLKLHDHTVILGVASVWEERKGFNDFLKLSGIIDSRCTIILVGLNDKQIKQLPANIIGIKRTESIEELAKLYSMANFFFNPTYEDNFPTTNIESLACGTPVITYNTGGSPETLSNETGWVVEQGDLNAVLGIIKSAELNNKPVAECRNRARNLYDQSRSSGAYLDLYNSYF